MWSYLVGAWGDMLFRHSSKLPLCFRRIVELNKQCSFIIDRIPVRDVGMTSWFWRGTRMVSFGLENLEQQRPAAVTVTATARRLELRERWAAAGNQAISRRRQIKTGRQRNKPAT